MVSTVYPSFLPRLQARSRPMRALPLSYAKILYFSELWQLDHIRLSSKLTWCQINEANHPENRYFPFNFMLYIFNTLTFLISATADLKTNVGPTFSALFQSPTKIFESSQTVIHTHKIFDWLCASCWVFVAIWYRLKEKKTYELLQHLFFTLFVKPTLFFNKCPKNLTLLVSLKSNITSKWIQLNSLWYLFPSNLTHCLD